MNPEGNIFSVLAFFVWIPIALWLARKWPPAKAAVLLLLIPLLTLPENTGFDLPGLPPLDKNQIAIFWLLIGVVLFHRDRLKSVRLSNWIKLSMLMVLVGNVATALLNTDPIVEGSVSLPGLTLTDARGSLILSTLDYLLPFVLAAAMFNSPRDLRVLFRVLIGAALVYSVLQLVELRLSPQLHYWVYGYHQHGFLSAMRGEGYRPRVFMHSGLALAMFTAIAIMAAAGLYKARIKIFGRSHGWVVAYLVFILFMSRSVAAFLYTQAALVLILFTGSKTQLRFAVLLAVTVLLYPTVRDAGLVPVDEIADVAIAEYGEERTRSLITRLTNEEKLLERANERFFFGWGGWCRSCIYDPWFGTQTSIRDGDWIITVGDYGRVGFLAKYLLLLLPLFIAARQWKRVRRDSDRRLLAALALMVGFSAFDLLPNGNFDYLVFALSGALFGCCRGTVLEAASQERSRRQQAVERQYAKASSKSVLMNPAARRASGTMASGP
jgi:hypothetical protein